MLSMSSRAMLGLSKKAAPYTSAPINMEFIRTTPSGEYRLRAVKVAITTITAFKASFLSFMSFV